MFDKLIELLILNIYGSITRIYNILIDPVYYERKYLVFPEEIAFNLVKHFIKIEAFRNQKKGINESCTIIDNYIKYINETTQKEIKEHKEEYVIFINRIINELTNITNNLYFIRFIILNEEIINKMVGYCSLIKFKFAYIGYYKDDNGFWEYVESLITGLTNCLAENPKITYNIQYFQSVFYLYIDAFKLLFSDEKYKKNIQDFYNKRYSADQELIYSKTREILSLMTRIKYKDCGVDYRYIEIL